MRNALILGTGGTGARVITRVKDLIGWRMSGDIDKLPNVKYYEIDTASNEYGLSSSNFRHLMVSRDDANRFRKDMDEGHHKWADLNAISEVVDGAGETRVRGKFGFLYHYDDIRRSVETRLDSLYRAAADNQATKKRIYIVANSVSGTGSGSFVDYGYLVRDIKETHATFRNDTQLNITLLLTLPTDENNPTHLRNSYYALEELNHYMSGNPYSIEDARHRETKHESRGADVYPFDYVYLVGPRQGSNNKTQELENIVGEYIYNDIYSPSAITRDGARDNMNKYEYSKDKLGYCQRYMTFGFSTIEYPAEQITKAATYKFLADSLAQWGEYSSEAPNYPYRDLLLGAGDHAEPKGGNIYYDLLKKTAVNVHGGDAIAVDVKEQLHSLVESAFSEFEENDYDTAEIDKLLRAIDEGFGESASVGKQYGPGTVSAVIGANKRGLLAGEGGWANRIKGALLEVMFKTSDGKRLAKEILGNVNARLEEIANKTADDQAHRSTRAEITAVCEDINEIRSSFVLKPLGLYKLPLKQRVDKCRKKVDDYIDERLDAAVKNAAKELTARNSETRKSLERFRGRLDLFGENIDSWAAELVGDYKKAATPQVLNGHIVRRGQIKELAGVLIANVGVGPFDFINAALKDNFWEILHRDNDDIGGGKSHIIYRKNKSELVELERKRFIDELGYVNVIEELTKERRDSEENSNADIIFEVDRKSELFISKQSVDSHSIGNALDIRKTLHKKWFFFPNGTLTTDGNCQDDEFSKTLNDNNMVDSWSEQCHDSADKRTILFLQEEGGFPVRYLNILHENQMKRALADSQAMTEVGINTFVSRVDVDFQPLKLIKAAELNSARVLLLASIAAKKLVFSREKQAFVYNQDEGTGGGWLYAMAANYGSFDSIRLPTEYKAAAYKLHENQSAQAKLKNELDEYITHNKVEFLENLHFLLVKDCKLFSLTLNDYSPRSLHEIIFLMGEEFIKPRNLLEDWNSLFPEAQIPDRTGFDLYERIAERDSGHPLVGWYCRGCGQYLGDTPDGSMSQSQLMEEFKAQHACGR